MLCNLLHMAVSMLLRNGWEKERKLYKLLASSLAVVGFFSYICTAMEEKKILDINTVNDYVDFVGAPRQHPHINIVDLAGLNSIPRSRDHYHIYGLLMLDNADSTLTHDINRSLQGGGTLMFSAPGCLTGIDNGLKVKLNGWLLLFDPMLIQDTPLGRHIGDFHFLTYEHQDALRLTPTESNALLGCFALLRRELQQPKAQKEEDNQVILDFLRLILDYCQRFYNRQFKQDTDSHSIHRRLRQVLNNYYERGLQFRQGVPNVRYCASELCLSANYLGDLMKQTQGTKAVTAIHEYVMERAKVLLATDKSVSHVAYDLGFDYPQHFIRLFKKFYEVTPAAYRRSLITPSQAAQTAVPEIENH